MKEPLFMEVVDGYRLAPLDARTAELIYLTLKPGKRYKITVANDRSRGQLNLYWAGLALLKENLPEDMEGRWPTTTALSKMLLEALGYTRTEYYKDREVQVADSIALDNMDATAFSEYFERARALVVALVGFDPWAEWIERNELRSQTSPDRQTVTS